MDRLYPYVLAPRLTPAIWGGSGLVTRYGKPGDGGQRLGESWECWDDNAVSNGALAGRSLAQLRALVGSELTGPIDAARPFPVLTKIIDAREALSVQVHPGDAYAQRVEHQANGKTECWYILACEPGAELVLGWTRDTSREEYERRVADGTLADILRRVPVRPGEVYYLPAGTLHAIGAGIQLFETQQTSDLTYRIFDWNRTGSDGKPRELHVAKAADVLDFRATFPGAVETVTFEARGARHTLAIADPRFAVERLDLVRGSTELETDARPLVITAMDAHLRLDAAGESTVLAPWQTAVTPAAASSVTVVAGGEAQVSALLVRPAPDRARLHERAAAAAGAAAAARFFGQFGG